MAVRWNRNCLFSRNLCIRVCRCCFVSNQQCRARVIRGISRFEISPHISAREDADLKSLSIPACQRTTLQELITHAFSLTGDFRSLPTRFVRRANYDPFPNCQSGPTPNHRPLPVSNSQVEMGGLSCPDKRTFTCCDRTTQSALHVLPPREVDPPKRHVAAANTLYRWH